MLGEYSMSTTLTNGLKLPDKGSVDWYADMQNNYAILDGAVGTIAEHTTALAGKAPLVHTHTKSDITDFPAYGNAAGTICEGNDSRLSDARTPVAHTHTKSDVTDLLNSDFIPSANNSYNLGSSANQWKKIYSADVVHTSENETITGVKTLIDYWHLQAQNLKAGEGEIYGRTGYSFIYTDKNDVTMGDVTLFKNANAARTFIRIRGGDYYTNGAPAAAGTLVQSALMVGTNASGKKIIECDSDIVYPTTNNATDLGDSTHKWKTLNGINPGALSLPNQDVNSVNLSGNITVLDGSASNDLTQTVNGWLFIYIENTTGAYIRCYVGSGSGTRTIIRGVVDAEQSQIYVFFPIYANITVSLYVNATSISRARFYPCLGNV